MNPTNNNAPQAFTTYEQHAISTALRAMERALRQPGLAMSSPTVVGDYLCLKLGTLPHEVFAVLYLNSHNQLIAFEEAFRGTLNQTSVYPREIVKSALMHIYGPKGSSWLLSGQDFTKGHTVKILPEDAARFTFGDRKALTGAMEGRYRFR